jgi:4-amino-4-deoxy-L-arabinose transferase-like glycosyltransferase
LTRTTPSFQDRARRAAPYVFWAVLLFVVLFWRLGAPSFWDPDEAHYAQTTRELIETGDWLAPYYNHQPFFDKPIFFHLLQALPMTVFGPTEMAARVVPALAALAIVFEIWWLGATLASAEVGLLAALLFTINPATFALARYAILDTLFTALLFGGASLVTVSAMRNRRNLQYWGYALLGAATLTKGPVALVLTGAAFVVAISVSSDARRRLLSLHWIRGILIVCAVAAPWFVYMLVRFGRQFVTGYFLNENLNLFTSPPYDNQPGWWFYLRILVVDMLPWSPVIIGRMFDDSRARWTGRGKLDTFEVLLLSWTGAIVVFFTLARFKLDHYVYPVIPSLCLLGARGWLDVCVPGDETQVRQSFGTRLGLTVVGPILVGAGAAIGGYIRMKLDLPLVAYAAPVALIAGGVVLTVREMRQRLPAIPWGAVAAFGVTFGVMVLTVGPAIEQFKVVPDMARWVTQHEAHATDVAAYRLNRWDPTFRLYVGHRTLVLDNPDQARAFFLSSDQPYCVMTAYEYQDLVSRGLPLEVVYARRGMWATSGRALWRSDSARAFTDFLIVTIRRDDTLASIIGKPNARGSVLLDRP